MGRLKSTMLFSALVVSLALCMYGAQQPSSQTKTPAAGQNPDQFDEAHRGVFSPKTNAGEEAARNTDALIKKVPPGPQAFAKIARKNFIDEHIFGRIERDKIPHSALSSDQEFVRRVYVDATGILPTAQQV